MYVRITKGTSNQSYIFTKSLLCYRADVKMSCRDTDYIFTILILILKLCLRKIASVKCNEAAHNVTRFRQPLYFQ